MYGQPRDEPEFSLAVNTFWLILSRVLVYGLVLVICLLLTAMVGMWEMVIGCTVWWATGRLTKR